jgi:hypothetical protein
MVEMMLLGFKEVKGDLKGRVRVSGRSLLVPENFRLLIPLKQLLRK